MFTRSLQITKKAFTLIEILIVIFVLGIGILSISVLITKNLSIVKNVHTQNTANILAREGLEMTYNIRDTNTLLGYRWDCAQRSNPTEQATVEEGSDMCKKYMRSEDGKEYRFTINGGGDSSKQISMSGIDGNDFTTLFTNSRLYLTSLNTQGVTITGYTHTHIQNTETSIFARYIEFTGMNDLPKNSPLTITNKDIHHITSKVLYTLSNTTTGEVNLESFISNQE